MIPKGHFYGDVAQMGERGVRNAEARGSIPLISILLLKGKLSGTDRQPV